jgi:hypothetical protein
VRNTPGALYCDVVLRKVMSRSREMTPMSRPERVMYTLLSLSMRKSWSTDRIDVVSISWNGDGSTRTVSLVRLQTTLVPYAIRNPGSVRSRSIISRNDLPAKARTQSMNLPPRLNAKWMGASSRSPACSSSRSSA